MSEAVGFRDMLLGDVLELKRGYDLPKRVRIEGNTPIISSSGNSGSHNEFKVEGPGVVTGRYGTIGEVHWVEDNFWPLNTSLYVRDFKGNYPKFVYYFMKTLNYEEYSDKAAVPGINRNHLHQAEVAIPSVTTQKAIAHILGALDDKIELNYQTNKTLEDIAKVLFKSWFVDFDPVHHKIDGRVVKASVDRPFSLSPDILDLFPDTFQDSDLGRIPAGWAVAALGDTAEILNGHAFKSKDYEESGIFVLRTKNFTDTGVVARQNDDVFLPTKFLDTHKQYICEPFDFHMVMVGASLGKTSLLLPHDLPALRNQNMWCFRANERNNRAYMRFALERLIVQVMGWASGSARSFFRKSDFKSHLVLQPNSVVLDSFQKTVEPMYIRISENNAEINTLSEIRDTLLPKLISGELPIKNAEHFLEKTGI